MSTGFIDSIIAKFDSESNGFWDFDVSGAMYLAAPEILSEDDRKKLLAETAPWELGTRNNRESCWGTHYAPLYEGTLEDGSRVVRPDISELGPSSLNIWKARLGTVVHPLMVARYADVIWDLGKVIDPASTRDFHYGRIAVDAYLDIAKGHFLEADIRVASALRRALAVSIELNDKERIDLVAQVLIEKGEQADLAAIGVWLAPEKAFGTNRHVRDIYRERLRGGLEKRLLEASQASNCFAVEAATEALLRIYKRETHITDRQRVVRTYSETFVRQAENTDPSVAISWLDKVAHVLEREGLVRDAEIVRLAMEKRGPESIAAMKTYTVKVKFDQKELEGQLDQILNVRHPMLALLKLALLLMPHCDLLRMRVVEFQRDFPFYSMIPRSILSYDGLPKAIIGPSDSDPDGRMIEEATHEFQLTAGFFKLGYDKAKKRFGFSSNELAEIFSGSSLIRPEAKTALEEAIEAYDTEDYLKVLSVLIPQIEAMMRELLQLLNIPLRKSIRGTGTELKNMNDVLSDPRVVETLEENLHFFLRILFIDKRSYNLRNEVAHGLLPSHAYNWATASLVMMSLVLLSVIGPHGVHMVSAENDKDIEAVIPQVQKEA